MIHDPFPQRSVDWEARGILQQNYWAFPPAQMREIFVKTKEMLEDIGGCFSSFPWELFYFWVFLIESLALRDFF